jgi:hypothetical protein
MPTIKQRPRRPAGGCRSLGGCRSPLTTALAEATVGDEGDGTERRYDGS